MTGQHPQNSSGVKSAYRSETEEVGKDGCSGRWPLPLQYLLGGGGLKALFRALFVGEFNGGLAKTR